jgi:hypothetical protein
MQAVESLLNAGRMTDPVIIANPLLQIPHDPEPFGAIANVAIVAIPGGRPDVVRFAREGAARTRRWQSPLVWAV